MELNFPKLVGHYNNQSKKDKQDTFAYQPEAVGPKDSFLYLAHDINISRAPISLKCIMKKRKWKCMDHTRLYKPRQITIGSHSVLWKIYQTLLTKKEKNVSLTMFLFCSPLGCITK